MARKASTEEEINFKRAKSAFSRGLYKQTINLLRSRYNLKKYSTPSGALELAAFTQEKLGNHRESLFLFTLLIKKKFSKLNRRVINSYKTNRHAEEIPEIDTKLAFYYYKKAVNAKALYDVDKNLLFYKAALMYAEISMENKDYEDRAEDLIEEIQSKNLEYKRLEFTRSTSFLISYITWQDKLTLTSPTGSQQEIRSSAEGTCLGGGINYENAYLNYKVDACFVFATATVGEDSKSVDYFQTNVSERAFFLFPGVRWKPALGGVSIGVSTPVVYRVGDFTEPEGFTIEDKSKLSLGLMIESGWKKGSFGVDLKIGKLIGFASTTMSFGGTYQF
jgi:hypothetical protein